MPDVKVEPKANPELIDVFIIILMAGAIDIFVFSMATQFVHDPVFQNLPSFIKDAYTAVWTSAVAGGAGIGAAIVKAFTRSPGTQTPNYIVYVLVTALAVFVAIFGVAYASRYVFPTEAQALEKCKRSVQAGQYDIALDRCAEATKEMPNEYMAAHFLGYAQYNLGQYAQAIINFEHALTLPGAERSMLLYNKARAQDSSGDQRGAIDTLSAALDSAPGGSALLGRIWMAKASIEQDLSIDSPDDNGLFDSAVRSYKAFLEIGKPTHWAHAGLACLYAVKATHSSAPEGAIKYEKEAVGEFDLALTNLRQLKPDSLRASEVAAFLREFTTASQCSPPLSGALAHQEQAPLMDKLSKLKP
jgi:tetratricopeptide (TPR) repeat protein